MPTEGRLTTDIDEASTNPRPKESVQDSDHDGSTTTQDGVSEDYTIRALSVDGFNFKDKESRLHVDAFNAHADYGSDAGSGCSSGRCGGDGGNYQDEDAKNISSQEGSHQDHTSDTTRADNHAHQQAVDHHTIHTVVDSNFTPDEDGDGVNANHHDHTNASSSGSDSSDSSGGSSGGSSGDGDGDNNPRDTTNEDHTIKALSVDELNNHADARSGSSNTSSDRSDRNGGDDDGDSNSSEKGPLEHNPDLFQASAVDNTITMRTVTVVPTSKDYATGEDHDFHRTGMQLNKSDIHTSTHPGSGDDNRKEVNNQGAHFGINGAVITQDITRHGNGPPHPYLNSDTSEATSRTLHAVAVTDADRDIDILVLRTLYEDEVDFTDPVQRSQVEQKYEVNLTASPTYYEWIWRMFAPLPLTRQSRRQLFQKHGIELRGDDLGYFEDP